MLNTIEDSVNQFSYYTEKLNDMKIEDKNLKQILFILLQCTLFSIENLNINDLVHISGFSKSMIKLKLSNPEIKQILTVDKSEKTYKYSLNLENM